MSKTQTRTYRFDPSLLAEIKKAAKKEKLKEPEFVRKVLAKEVRFTPEVKW